MNQEIEGKLETLLLKLQQDTLRATTRHCRLDLRKKAIKAIQELVCSTVPERFCSKVNDNDGGGSYEQRIGFNTACIEILKKWGKA